MDNRFFVAGFFSGLSSEMQKEGAKEKKQISPYRHPALGALGGALGVGLVGEAIRREEIKLPMERSLKRSMKRWGWLWPVGGAVTGAGIMGLEWWLLNKMLGKKKKK